MKRTFASAGARLVATAAMALSLTVAISGPAAAEDEPAELSAAEEVRALVLKQRVKVLAQIDAIFAGNEKEAEAEKFQAEIVEPEDGEAEDGEPEDGEPEDGEPEGGEAEDGEPEDGEPEGDEGVGGEEEDGEGEGEDEEVDEMPGTGVGHLAGAGGSLPALIAAAGAFAAGGLSLRRRFGEDAR